MSVCQTVITSSTHTSCVVLFFPSAPPTDALFKKKKRGGEATRQPRPSQLSPCDAILLLAVQLATPCDLLSNWQIMYRETLAEYNHEIIR